ncbi:myosin light chain kinase, smooth muscle-like isoform X2 [Hydractinia symbiolongicarpus]|uniref:myosin light chain kinase, smooth muscle-like isoform X2 n=1 Tax=Hydractinia symbiolongicarpus TaxID=13093 RepID=UPI00254A55A5|nr:myosin light chain kinase, smooth muscle-like isoform X2 [Hydractinia symbiolongicarpus]
MPKKTPQAPKFVEKLENIEVNVGKTAIIDCVCTGEPEPDCDWFFEEKPIKDEGRFRYLFEKDDVIGLEIKKVTAEDEGEYKCVAFNKSGEVESKCTILVNDPDKKKPAKKESTDPMAGVTNFQKQAAGRLFTPPGRKNKKKKKLPIEREGIIAENPEKFYTFGDEIGRGKFSVVRQAVNMKTKQKYAAKIIKFDADSLKFAIREYDLMASGKTVTKGTVKLHEAYLVQKYLILIMDLIEGKTLLDQVSHRHSLNEDDVAYIIRQLCETLAELHSRNVIHLDLRPTNIRFYSGREVKLLDYNSSRHIANKFAGEVVDVIGDTEFCAPELLNFEPVLPGSDMWSVGVITYIMLSGISPFFYEDESKVVMSVQNVKWKFDEDAFENVSSNAKDFIKKIFVRIPEQRLTAVGALKHPWLSKDYEAQRKNCVLTNALDEMQATDERLYSEEEEDYVDASLVFRTFDEEMYESPEESDDDDEEE